MYPNAIACRPTWIRVLRFSSLSLCARVRAPWKGANGGRGGGLAAKKKKEESNRFDDYEIAFQSIASLFYRLKVMAGERERKLWNQSGWTWLTPFVRACFPFLFLSCSCMHTRGVGGRGRGGEKGGRKRASTEMLLTLLEHI